MKNIVVFIIVILVCTNNIFGQEEDLVLRNIESLGKNIYEYDKACWVATDLLKANHPDTSLLGNFIARKENNLWKVGFGKLAQDESHFLLAYEVIINSSNKESNILTYTIPKIDTEFYYKASKAYYVTRNELGDAQLPYNYCVIKKDNENLYVYFYPSQPSLEYYYLGGDIRFTYNSILNKITGQFKLHKSIIKMPYSNKGNEEAVATFANAVLTTTPVETDILYVLSRNFKGDHYVGAGEWVYIIDASGVVKSKISRKELE